MGRNTNWIVSYDISDDRLLRKTADYLEKKGLRIQKSVFFVKTDSQGIRTIKDKIYSLLGNEHRVIVIPVCATCMGRAQFLGPEEKSWVID
ncbi:MAG: CRISPR-associated endonuclease Cas2 [Deltaproteobacteria bacterium]|nr:CRISPR-associated endonuclease Cas2 [Deltaproteobacteria bacterium]